ncbi:MAG: protein-tyrosine phosphatase family protein [Anaerolineales bacterium]
MSVVKKAEPLPIPESYWVEPGRLLAGEYPGGFDGELTRKHIHALLEAGFDTFIDLTGPNETLAYAQMLFDEARTYEVEVEYYRFPIEDFGLPSPEQMKSILDRMDERLQAGHKMYLHCWGGIGRTGTTVGCYLVRHGRTGEEALKQLAKWWKKVPKSYYHPRSPETQEQADFIRHWSEHEANP